MSQEVNRNPWDERYSSESYFYGTEPNDFLRDCVNAIPRGGRVLCLAEGEGRNAVFLASLGFRVTAMDGSQVGLEKMARLAGERDVSITGIHADLNDFPIESDSWDAIVSVWCHTPPALRQRLHAQCVKGLRKGGVFILEAYRPKQLEYKTGGPPTAELMMTLAALENELSGLSLEIGREMDREIHEGKGHAGMSAVVQVLARKS